jgi:hypothetical protein
MLPLGTELCVSERDLESWASNRRPGPTCFQLSTPAPYVVMARNGVNREEVMLTAGKRKGTVAWAASASGMR